MSADTRRTGLVSGLAGLAFVLSLSGCALLRGPQEKPEPDAQTHVNASYRVDVQAPAEVRTLLVNYLDLTRFQEAPQSEALSSIELDRLCGATPAQARALLETEGYFNAKVEVTRTPDTPERIVVSVDPGPPARVERISFDISGPLNEAAAQPGPAQTLAQRMVKDWTLPDGSAFTQARWASAKTESLIRARTNGYLMARWETTEARIDVQSRQAQISLKLASGPLFRLGDISIEGLQRQQESSVRRLAGFAKGDAYQEKTLLDFQERLQGAGLFDSASVDIDPDPERAAAATVHVRLHEARLQDATASVGYSANTGARVAIEHVHRRPFNLNVSSKLKLELGRTKRLFEGELTSHATPGMYRNLLAAKAERLDANGEIVDTASLRLGRLQETPKQDRSYFVEALHGQVKNIAGITAADARSINYQWTWRRIDSALQPTDGWVASAQLATGVSRGNAASRGPFVRGWTRLSWYRPVGKQWFAYARMEAGEVFAKDSLGLPDALLFRAGGDDSVRGYAYRTLGPTGIDGLLKSGRVLWTGSVEMARPLLSDKPQYLGAVFIDAGQAADSWKGFRPVYGYGLGLRWRSPVGPLRIDLAWPEGGNKPRLHFSVGVAF